MSDIQNIRRPDQAGLFQPSPMDAFKEVMSAARTQLDTPTVLKPAKTEKPLEASTQPDVNQAQNPDKSTESAKASPSADASSQVQDASRAQNTPQSQSVAQPEKTQEGDQTQRADQTQADQPQQSPPVDQSEQVSATSRTQDAQAAQKSAPPEQAQKADNQQAQAGQMPPTDPSAQMPDVSRTQESQPTPQLAQPDQAQKLENPQQKAVTNSASADWAQALPSGQWQMPSNQNVQTGNLIFLHSSQAAQQAQASAPPQNAWDANKVSAQHIPSITPKIVRSKEAPVEGQRVVDYRGDRQPVSGQSQWMILPTRAFG